jgi:hypothetical protein
MAAPCNVRGGLRLRCGSTPSSSPSANAEKGFYLWSEEIACNAYPYVDKQRTPPTLPARVRDVNWIVAPIRIPIPRLGIVG